MSGALATSWAFFLRDLRLAISYRLGFVLQLVGAAASVVLLFYVSAFFGPVLDDRLQRYGGSYFAFAIIGLAFTTYLTTGLTAMSSKIRDGQLMGTLELMLISPTRLPVALLSSALWAHVMATVGVVAYLVGAAVLGADLGGANVPAALLGLGLAIVAFNAIGLLAAAFVIVFKQSGPINWLVSTSSVVLAGVLYPASVLPAPLQAVAQALPLTPALEVVRRAVLEGEPVGALIGPLAHLAALTAVYLPLGVLACHLAVRLAQRDGSLSTY